MTTTIETKRPVSGVVLGDWTISGAQPTMWQALADVSVDTTYIHATSQPTTGRVKLATLAVPAGAVVTSAITRIRSRATNAGSTLGLAFNDRVSTTINVPVSGSFSLRSAASLTPTVAELAAGVILRLTANKILVEVAEAYVDVTYVSAPSVNVTAPTGTIGVSQPTVTWDYTGDLPQERFRIKVFNSAQYSGVGFNVDSSSGLYDSGVQLSATESFVPTVNLPNTDTYRVYVRVAQKVGSVTQWSAWDFTTTTVTVTPPPTPTVAVDPDNPLGRIKITVTDTGTPTWEFVNVERSIDGGVTWQTVRSASRRPVSGTEFIVYDYETGNSQPVAYRAQAVIADTGGDIASAWSTASGEEFWTSTDTWLKSLTSPTANALVRINEIPTLKRRLPSNVIDVAGRADPIVRSDIRRRVEGTVTFAVVDDAALDQIIMLLDRSEVLLLQTPETDGWGSKYIAIGDVDENRVGRMSLREERLVVCPFTEVVAPVGEVVTFGTTWEQVVNAYADWTALETAQSTWTQLVNAEL